MASRAVKDGLGSAPPSPADGLRHRLKSFRTFVQVAVASSISGGAKQLFRAPSSVNRSLLQLEAAVGAQLFIRSAHGIVLSRIGAIALARATRIDEELKASAAELMRHDPTLSRSAIDDLLFSSSKLELLIQIADTRTIAAAAAQIGMTQSGAGMALTRLEAAVGRSLFLRTGYGMLPTDATRCIIASARRVFAELRALASDISAEAGQVAGSIVVGAIAISRSRLLPSAIAATLRDYPQIKVKTIEGPFQALAPALRSGEIDVYIGHRPEPEHMRGFSCERLFCDQLAIVCGAHHPLAGRQIVSFEDLLASRWIMPWQKSSTRHMIESIFEAHGQTPPDPAVETCDIILSRQLLATTEMLAAVSREQYERDLAAGILMQLPIRLNSFYREVCLILREGALPSAATSILIDNLRTSATHGQSGSLSRTPRQSTDPLLSVRPGLLRRAIRNDSNPQHLTVIS